MAGTVVSLANYARRTLGGMFPGFFLEAKHDHYKDFGFPAAIGFEQTYAMYSRNGLAKAAVNKTVAKTWQDEPFLLEKERDGSQRGEDVETKLEREIRLHFAKLRLWQKLAETDRRGMVGQYSGLILRLADSKKFSEPVDRVAGLEALVEVIPAWEGQLTVEQWDTDEASSSYGHPAMFSFNETAVGGQREGRKFAVHPDRVLVWSEDGTVYGRSLLEAGYNDLITLEKVVGAGGEGFWKNAKSAPILEVDKEARIAEMAAMMGVPQDEVADKMNEQVRDWQAGFDQLLMVQGMQAKTLGVTLPSPEHFFGVALQSFCASVQMPVKIMVGMQTGERASSEDADEWAQTNMARRDNIVIPNFMALVGRLVRFGALPEKDWFLDWTDLTETSIGEKIARADKMADVNQKMKDTGEFIFTPEEIRAAVDLEPLGDGDKYRDDNLDEEAAVTPPVPKE